MIIRNARVGDLPAIVDLRNYYILNSHALFESNPEKVEERQSWFEKYKTTGPHRILVAEENQKVVGYAYSSKYRDGEYFSQTVEVSVYIDPAQKRTGIGSALYEKLFLLLRQENIHCAVAGIALPNDASIRLHEKFSFEKVGVFSEYAVKNGAFISSIWMQRIFS